MFIQGNTDNDILNYLAKSMSEEDLSKALGPGLVKKQVPVRTKNGIRMADRWVREGDDLNNSPVKNPVSEEKEKPKKKVEVPATEHTITDKNKHLVSVKSYDDIPQEIHQNVAKGIPKGWRNIMISPDPNADLLCIGKDAKDRTQYVYNKNFANQKQQEKFERVKELTKKYNDLCEAVQNMEDRETGDCLDLIIHTALRPGSTRDTKSDKEARGATTLKGENVVIEGDRVFLDFIGKKGVHQHHEITDDHLKDMLKTRKEKAGDDGDLFKTDDAKLRFALEPFGVHTKDLRTMVGSDQARKVLKTMEKPKTVKDFIKARNKVADHVCSVLGNTRQMALNAYIDPSIFEEWSPEIHKEWQEKITSKGGKDNGK